MVWLHRFLHQPYHHSIPIFYDTKLCIHPLHDRVKTQSLFCGQDTLHKVLDFCRTQCPVVHHLSSSLFQLEVSTHQVS